VKIFKPVPFQELGAYTDSDEDGEKELLRKHIGSLVEDFLDKHPRAVRQQVEKKIAAEVTRNLARAKQAATAYAVESLLEAAMIPSRVSAPKNQKLTINVTILKPSALVQAWQRETENVGLTWNPKLRADDIRDVVMLCKMLDNYAKAFNIENLAERYALYISSELM
jgi:hypothetical protein